MIPVANCSHSLLDFCVISEPGYYITDELKVEICSDGCEVCEDGEECLSCMDGYIMNKSTCITKCPVGIFYLLENQCKSCDDCLDCTTCPSCFQCSVLLVYTVTFTTSSIKFEFNGNITLNTRLLVYLVSYADPPIASNTPSLRNLVSSDFFNVSASNCKSSLPDNFLKVSLDGSILLFKFDNIGKNTACTFHLSLSRNIFLNPLGKLIALSESYTITVAKNTDLSIAKRLSQTVESITKIAILTMSMTFSHLFSVFIYLIASTSVIDFLTVLNDSDSSRIYSIVRHFTMSLDIRLHLFEDTHLESYYVNIMNRKSKAPYLVEYDWLNYIDIKRLTFIIFFLSKEIIDIVSTVLKRKISKRYKKVSSMLDNFMLAYTSTDFITFLFRRLFFYRYVDPSLDYIKYLLIDLGTLVFVIVKILHMAMDQIDSCVNLLVESRKLGATTNVTAKILAKLQNLIVFIKNLFLIISLVFLEKYRTANQLTCSLIALLAMGFSIFQLKHTRSAESVFFFMSEVSFMFLFINIILFKNNSVSPFLVLIGCLFKAVIILIAVLYTILKNIQERYMPSFRQISV